MQQHPPMAGFESLKETIGNGMKRRRQTFETLGGEKEWEGNNNPLNATSYLSQYYSPKNESQYNTRSGGSPGISNLVRDSVVKMAQITLSHLDSLCSFIGEVDPEGLQNSQLELALAILSRFTHNLDVARPTVDSHRGSICPQSYTELPSLRPRKSYNNACSSPAIPNMTVDFPLEETEYNFHENPQGNVQPSFHNNNNNYYNNNSNNMDTMATNPGIVITITGDKTSSINQNNNCYNNIGSGLKYYTAPRPVSPPPPAVFSRFFPAPSITLDCFELGPTLGTGTFGLARLCKHKTTGNFFCLKIVSKETVIKLKQKGHIMNEKKILSRIHHPFIVRLYTTFQDETNLYFLMEFVPGGELFTHIRRTKSGHLSNSAACFFAAEIVLALRYIHSLHIAHRDLKPENVLLSESGHVKLVDFGFAKEIKDRTWTMCGTPHYIAPEIILGRGHTKLVDFWSLGVMIYEMLTGLPPFCGQSKLEIFQKIIGNQGIYFPDYVESNAQDIIRKLLVNDHTNRLGFGGTEEVMRHPWFRDIDWDALYHCGTPVPISLNISREGDPSFYVQPEEEERSELLHTIHRPGQGGGSPDHVEVFKGF